MVYYSQGVLRGRKDLENSVSWLQGPEEITWSLKEMLWLPLPTPPVQPPEWGQSPHRALKKNPTFSVLPSTCQNASSDPLGEGVWRSMKGWV